MYGYVTTGQDVSTCDRWGEKYIVFFSPVKPELGVIPSGQEIMSEYLNFPGKELNVTIIIQSNKFFKKNNKTGHIGL